MAKLINDTYTGTGSVGSFPPNCENCPRIVSPNSTSTPKYPTENSLYELVANSLVGLIAQRLLRKVCPNCAKEVETTEQERILLGEDVRTVKRGMGCSQCNHTGYRGRIAVHEILAINQDIRRMIMEHESVENITKYAREHQHMRTLKESGLILVKEGVTTPEELMKISYE